jgi:hypothetical protein
MVVAVTATVTGTGRRLAAGAVALALAWTLGPALPGPPLYDGIGFPDEPYRYVQRPPGTAATAAATSASGAAHRQPDNTFEALIAQSAESGPQVLVVIGAQQLTAPAACTAVTMRADPQAPSQPVATGPTWGNAYRVVLTCSAGATGPATAKVSSVDTIQLRAPDGRQPGPIMHYTPGDGAPWRALTTTRIGNDNYRAPLVGTGEYVLVRRPGGTGLPFGLDPIVAVLIGVLIALVAVIVVIRVRRTRAFRRAAADDDNSDDDRPL